MWYLTAYRRPRRCSFPYQHTTVLKRVLLDVIISTTILSAHPCFCYFLGTRIVNSIEGNFHGWEKDFKNMVARQNPCEEEPTMMKPYYANTSIIYHSDLIADEIGSVKEDYLYQSICILKMLIIKLHQSTNDKNTNQHKPQCRTFHKSPIILYIAIDTSILYEHMTDIFSCS